MALFRLASRARAILRQIARTGQRGREVRRAQALLWLDQQETVRQVAHRLRLTRQTVYAVVKRYRARQARPVRERIADARHRGRPATQRHQTREIVKELLAQSPTRYRYRSRVWTVPMLRRQVQKRLKRDLSLRTVRRALHDLGYNFKRPRYVYAQRPRYWRQEKGGSKPA